MQEWLINCSSKYLNRILRGEAIDSEAPQCGICKSADKVYMCTDSFHTVLQCVNCVKVAHLNLPTHRLHQWTGTHFQCVRSRDIGYVFHLGHDGLPCDLEYNRLFTLIGSNGIHELNI
jgi:hypothetical protein